MVRSPARAAALVGLAAALIAVAPSTSSAAPSAAAATSGTVTTTAVQDSYTSQSNASATHGSLTYLAADGVAGAERRTYLMFTVSGVPADATSVTASLRLDASSSSSSPFTVSAESTAWSSSTLTWNNQPAPGGQLASRPGVSAGYDAFDVSSAVRANGTVAFVVRTTSTAEVLFASRESNGSPPQLVVSWTTTTSDPVLAAAGDIACAPGAAVTATTCHQAATAALLTGSDITAVQTLGDNQYASGTSAEFAGGYATTWGAVRSKTHPAPGNHEYSTPGATGYYGYFGSAAGDPSRGYYSYDLGAWHVVVLNSEISFAAGSAQDVWFRGDLAAHPVRCTLAVWHEPVFSSSSGVDSSRMRLFSDAYAGGVDVVLNGHQHNYERFAPQTPSGTADATSGVREFVVGTGGYSVWGTATPLATSQARGRSFGVLRLTLHATSYDWRFVPVAGSTYSDSGTATCH